jgi:hypothetical protein
MIAASLLETVSAPKIASPVARASIGERGAAD